MMITFVISLAVGAALGACLRAWASAHIPASKRIYWITPTLWINILACVLMGFFVILIPALLPVQTVGEGIYTVLSAGVLTGFLGSLSTMSTVSYEAIDRTRQFGRSVGIQYIIGMSVLCLVSVIVGMIIAYALMFVLYLI